jgi:hypothetical protein
MASSAIADFVSRHTNNSVLLDSNLLVVLIGSELGPEEFKKLKRAEFSFEDAILLRAVVAQYRAIVTTPAILAEASNLAGFAPERTAAACRILLGQWLEGVEEINERGLSVVEYETYPRLGFTDATAARIAEAKHVVLTADVGLYLDLESHDLPCLNFRHLQAARLLQ